MKKKNYIIILLFLLTVLTILFFTLRFKLKKIYYDPKYNANIITNINNIELSNSKIKNKYQFVYMVDLHMSVIDENETNEEIKNMQLERNKMFVDQHVNKIQGKDIFSEVINYTNNKHSDALLLGGDIIDNPAESNFRELNNSIKKLKTNHLYTLGNHDWSFAWDYHTQHAKELFYPRFEELMDDIQVSYLEYKDLIILAINDSTDQIEEESLEKIKNILEKKKPTIVMIHVPIATEYISEEAVRIRNRVSAIGEEGVKPNETTKKALDMILSDKYEVFYIISGHVHFAVEDNITEAIFENVSAPAYSGNINLIKINN